MGLPRDIPSNWTVLVVLECTKTMETGGEVYWLPWYLWYFPLLICMNRLDNILLQFTYFYSFVQVGSYLIVQTVETDLEICWRNSGIMCFHLPPWVSCFDWVLCLWKRVLDWKDCCCHCYWGGFFSILLKFNTRPRMTNKVLSRLCYRHTVRFYFLL